MERRDSRRAVHSTGEELRSANLLGHLTDRQLLEELVERLRALQPLIDAAERHPWVRGLLRRF